MRLFGGFSGTETSSHQRDPSGDETVLSGDLRGDDRLSFANNDENSYHVLIASGSEPNAVLDGFIIAGGNANGPKEGDHRYGGGIYNLAGCPTIANCVFRYNSAVSYGGGIYNYYTKRGPTLNNCSFTHNRAGAGGGINNNVSNSIIANCTFSGNMAGWGGGVYNSSSSSVLTNCTLISNFAEGNGGGMCNNERGSLILTNCILVGNSAKIGGGGLANFKGSNATLTNCLFSGNLVDAHVPEKRGGGGINNAGADVSLTNCTLVGNSGDFGGGMLNSDRGSVDLTNCILWGNSSSSGIDESAQIDNTRTDLRSTINHCCVQGWTGKLDGVGNFGSNPLFIDPNGPDNEIGTEDDNLCLSPNSPCLNAGDNSAIPADTTDLDGDDDTNEPIPFDIEGKPRILNGTVDIGAYEGG